jgi:hypothetical protein
MPLNRKTEFMVVVGWALGNGIFLEPLESRQYHMVKAGPRQKKNVAKKYDWRHHSDLMSLLLMDRNNMITT